MSRTDAHVPYDVWMRRHPDRVIAEHDHRTGVCDLPDCVELLSTTACRWSVAGLLPRLCGCGLCTGRPWRRFDHHLTRQRVRLLLSSGHEAAWLAAEAVRPDRC